MRTVCVYTCVNDLLSYLFIPFQPVNQVVLWDKIILRGDSAYLDLSGVKTKYRFFDDGKGLKYVLKHDYCTHCLLTV